MNDYPRRGEIYWVDLDPTIGTETKKIRPCLIISSDTGNKYSPLVMVAPITSKTHNLYPFEAQLKVNGKTGKVMLNQARAIDKRRLRKKIGFIGIEQMSMVDKAIKLVFGIN